ncbi:probable myosin-binding protein 5 isoform X2 [Jatropha curcas]|uniref:probable myosin-binding protein 5 isoform X2 n=1 Tax=Jatropha curcas TaxID=180498 RepID=UPI0009D75166|nr:probable myosin-binding protein 5 isoform X2 [Jatropha curcas]
MAKRSFKNFVEQEMGQFPLFLIYAALEWVLIIVLFIDGFLAFFANEFARFFELKIPCLLCTRIDHILVHKAADFYYNDSVCEPHKKDLSCLAYCHNHKKLSDINKMCESCLLSFATEKSSDCHTYKSLVGILHKDIELFVDNEQDPHLISPCGRKDDPLQQPEKTLFRCSCCGEPLRIKPYFKGKGSSMVSQAPTPSPRFTNLRNDEHRNIELSHMRYNELKFSDNESELHEDEDGPNASHLAREDVKAATLPLLPEADDMNEDRTPIFARGNKFFGIPLTDSATASPRFANRIPRKSPLEKTEFASESTEGGNAPNEPEGDLILHHLKGQVRLDRKSLMALYMELDEERSASAVAANNAMAMITRLQAEKAAVQMEALQYQRMMEEQAEYDQEALQATNDLLAKREEDIKVLEAELDEYRERYGLLREEGFEGSGDEVDEDYHDMSSHSFSSYTDRSQYGGIAYSNSIDRHINGENMLHNSQSSSLWDENGGEILDQSRKDFHGGRSCTLGRFKNLDKKNQIFSDDAAPSPLSSSYNVACLDEETVPDGKLMDELLHLHERVKALEADGEFSKHVVAGQTIQNDSEREKLLTEICDNIQKLRHFISMPLDDDDHNAQLLS